MHDGQLEVSTDLVARLVAEQFPSLVGHSVEPVTSAGTVNPIFRVGHELAARLPLQAEDVAAARARLDVEARAAEEFAACSPVPAPVPRGIDEPGYERILAVT